MFTRHRHNPPDKLNCHSMGTYALPPIRPDDESLMKQFHETLSDRTVYTRYFCSLSLRSRVAHERLVRICHGTDAHRADSEHSFAEVPTKNSPPDSNAPRKERLLSAC